MKKILALVLASVMMLTLFAACGNTNTPDASENNTPDASENGTPEVAGPASAVELLTNVFNSYANPDSRPAMGGGSGDTMNFEAPGAVAPTDSDTLTATLKVPAEQLTNITDAASVMHMMNANNLTGAAFKVTGDSAAFVEALKESVLGTQWMCGFPEQLVIATVGEYVVMTYGLAGVTDPEANFVGDFVTALTTAYPNAVIVVEQEIL